MLFRFLRSKKLLILLCTAIFLDLQKPGYMTFANPTDLLPKQCNKAQTFTIPNLPGLKIGLSKTSTLEIWSRRLGKPTCFQGDNPLWEVPGAFYLSLQVDQNGIVTGYQFHR